jgi:hypothetical protein
MILAAESRTTYSVGERHRIASDFTQKVYPVSEKFAVATYGWNTIGGRTIAGLMDQFVSQLGRRKPRDAEAIAAALGSFFHKRFVEDISEEEQAKWGETTGYFPLGFAVAGYDGDGIGRIREVAIPGPDIEKDTEITTAHGGALWRGQTDVIRRLLFGFDADAFGAAGHELPEDLQEPVANLRYDLLFPITMQDAVDFASFLIRTTIDMQRFSDGTVTDTGNLPGCGGPIRILAITREGVQWVAPPVLTDSTGPGVAEGAPL